MAGGKAGAALVAGGLAVVTLEDDFAAGALVAGALAVVTLGDDFAAGVLVAGALAEAEVACMSVCACTTAPQPIKNPSPTAKARRVRGTNLAMTRKRQRNRYRSCPLTPRSRKLPARFCAGPLFPAGTCICVTSRPTARQTPKPPPRAQRQMRRQGQRRLLFRPATGQGARGEPRVRLRHRGTTQQAPYRFVARIEVIPLREVAGRFCVHNRLNPKGRAELRTFFWRGLAWLVSPLFSRYSCKAPRSVSRARNKSDFVAGMLVFRISAICS